VYINARGQKYSELLELSEDPESPLDKCVATYTVDYSMSIRAGVVRFSLEAINADTSGTILNEWHTQTYQAKVQDTLQGNQIEWAETESDIISALIIEVQNKVAQLVGGATPEPKNLVADMTDPKKVYLYVGSEEDESNGYWYYHNGTRFVPGGLYASGITVDAVPTQGSTNAVSSGGVWSALHDSSGVSEQAAQLLVGILQKGIYSTDVSTDIDTLYELLTNESEIEISATSVTLNETTVTILDASKTVQLIATPVPSVTTDAPVWTSTDNTVATVDANGVVTGIADGNCVIRCTYGNVFAECSVYCTLGADLIYMLPTAFTGDGETVINTGWKMAGANDPDSGYNTDFSICYDVEVTAVSSSQMTFISHINSEGKKYLWDIADIANGNTKITSQTLAAQRATTAWTKNVPIRAKCVKTHVKQAREMSQYFYYVTGDTLTKVENFVESNAALLSYDIPNAVILGGAQNADGTIASYMDSSVTIHDFKIYSRVLSTSEISEYLGEDVTA